LFSTDGWACKRAPKNRSSIAAEVGYSSNSETLIRQVQSLLLRFGIHSNLSFRPKVENWQLFIHRTGDVLEFAKKIGMMGHKGKALKECVEICESKAGSQQLPKWRTKNAHPGTLWEEIVSIEYIGEENTVGIEVDEYHTYLTDFYEHNSFIASRAVFWWMLAVGGCVYTTAPTEQLVHDVLWGEIRRLYIKKSVIFPAEARQLQLSLKINESVFATGFTASEYKASTFTGRHAGKQLIIMDESSDISQMIDEGFISCLTGSSNRGLRIGNPLVPATPFHFACRTEGSIRITAWNHPNVSWAYEVCSDGIHRLKPEVERDIMTVNENGLRVVKQQDDWPPQYPRDLISGAISIDYIENNARPRGENSAFWLSRIEGIFPTDSSYSIIPTSLFLSARARYDSDPEYWDALALACQSRIGVDVGDAIDPHAYARWQGPVLYSVEEEPTRGDQHDQERCAAKVVSMLREYPGVAHVDRIGVGAAVAGMIQNEGFTAWGVAWSETELLEDPAQFVNIKIENQFDLRKALESGEAVIAPLGAAVEDKLMEEMSATNYENTPSGKVKCELKTKTRKRIGRSTNLFDAVVYGHSHKTSVAAMVESAMKFLS
jgi:LAGLIDADG-like domain